MGAVYKREVKANLMSMTGTIFVVFTLVFLGLFCAVYTFQGSAHLESAIVSAGFMSLLAVPVLTMRTFTEERQSKTDQLLFSLPLTTAQIVCGKFFALATVMAVPTAVLCIYPLITAALCASGSINFGLIYASVLCYFLLGCAVIAVCMFLSSLTESQVISVIISLAAVLLLYYMPTFSSMISTNATLSFVITLAVIAVVAYIIWASVKNYVVAGIAGGVLVIAASVTFALKSSFYEGLIGKVFEALAIFRPIQNFANGVFDVTSIIYYLSVTALFVFFTVQSVEKRRWN